MDKQTSFWIGGLSSIALYSLMLFFIFYQLTHKPKKVAMMSSSSSMEVAINMAEIKPVENKPTPEVVQKPQPVPTPPKVEQKPDEFAEAKKIIKKPEPPKPVEEQKERPLDTKQLMQAIKQPVKEQPKEQTKAEPTPKTSDAKSIINSLDLKKNTLNVSFNSSGEFDAYLNKVAQIIRSGWNPYSSDAGLVATINININPDGSFNFKVKTASSNSDFNMRLSEYLRTIQTKGLPVPDNRKSVSVDFNFKATQ